MSLEQENSNATAATVSQPAPQSAPESAPNTAQVSAPTVPGAAPQEQAPAYTPNLEFKVMDNVHTIDKMYAPLLKDQETEKKIRELHEKAYGLDVVKPKYQSLKDEHGALKAEYEKISESLNHLSTFVKNDDLGSFFQALNIPESMVYRYVMNRLQYQDMPPEQKKHYDEYMELKRKNQLLEQQSQQYYQSAESVAAEARSKEVDWLIQSPEYSQAVAEFDARMGQPGAFKNEVYQKAVAIWYQSGQKQDISAKEAVDLVVKSYGLGQQIPAQAPVTPPNVAAVNNMKQKPVIPTIQAGAGSPTKKEIGSIADLRKAAAAL